MVIIYSGSSSPDHSPKIHSLMFRSQSYLLSSLGGLYSPACCLCPLQHSIGDGINVCSSCFCVLIMNKYVNRLNCGPLASAQRGPPFKRLERFLAELPAWRDSMKGRRKKGYTVANERLIKSQAMDGRDPRCVLETPRRALNVLETSTANVAGPCQAGGTAGTPTLRWRGEGAIVVGLAWRWTHCCKVGMAMWPLLEKTPLKSHSGPDGAAASFTGPRNLVI